MNVITQAVTVSRGGILDDSAIVIEVHDLGGGEFVKISQPFSEETNWVGIDADEWPIIRSQINKMFADIKRRDG